MSTEILFQISNFIVLPFWTLMIFAPHWSWTKRIMASLWVVVPSAALHLSLTVPQLGYIFTSLASRPTAAGVAALMSDPIAATISWAHFLAIDLFIGRWMYLDSRERNLSAWIVSPILGVAFMFSPIGFLFYLAARYISERRR
jgi:hypothetical protein